MYLNLGSNCCGPGLDFRYGGGSLHVLWANLSSSGNVSVILGKRCFVKQSLSVLSSVCSEIQFSSSSTTTSESQDPSSGDQAASALQQQLLLMVARRTLSETPRVHCNISVSSVLINCFINKCCRLVAEPVLLLSCAFFCLVQLTWEKIYFYADRCNSAAFYRHWGVS